MNWTFAVLISMFFFYQKGQTKNIDIAIPEELTKKELLGKRTINDNLIDFPYSNHNYNFNEKNNSEALIQSIIQKSYSFNDFDVESLRYHLTSIDTVKYRHFQLQADSDSDYEIVLLISIFPELNPDIYTDAWKSYNLIYLLDHSGEEWYTKYYGNAELDDFSTFSTEDNISISDFNSDGVNEFQVLTHSVTSMPGGFTLEVYQITIHGIKSIWNINNSMRRIYYDNLNNQIINIDRIWGKGEGRYGTHYWKVEYYDFYDGKFTLSKELKTTKKFYFETSNEDILNNAITPVIDEIRYLKQNYNTYNNLNSVSSPFKYESKTGYTNNWTYNYDVEGYDDDGAYYYGNIDINNQTNSGSGFLYNEEGDEIEIDVQWANFGQIIGSDKNNNEFDLSAR